MFSCRRLFTHSRYVYIHVSSVADRLIKYTPIMEDVNIKDFPSLFSLKGKVAVVTGGSRGLGLNAASA